MFQLFANVRAAADNLVKVAHALHTPLDTSTFVQAVDELEKAVVTAAAPVVEKAADEVVHAVVEKVVEKVEPKADDADKKK